MVGEKLGGMCINCNKCHQNWLLRVKRNMQKQRNVGFLREGFGVGGSLVKCLTLS